MMIKKLVIFLKKYFFTLPLVIFSYSFGLFDRKTRGVVTVIWDYFHLYRTNRNYVKPLISVVKFEELLPDFECKIIHSETKHGNVFLEELIIMNSFIRKYNLNTIFEIGTFNGRTTLNFAENISNSGRIYTLDLPRSEQEYAKFRTDKIDVPLINKDISGELFQNTSHFKAGRIIQLYGDSATFDFSPFYNTMDMVFIDGSHSYEYVKNDSDIAFKLLKNKKGIIFWHDYDKHSPGTTKFLNELNSDLNNLFHIRNTSLVFIKNLK